MWMDDIELDLKKMEVKGWKTRPNVKGAEKENEEEGMVTLYFCLIVNVMFIALGIVRVKFCVQTEYESRRS